MEMKKILLVTPRFPYPEAGACEQDRAEGIRQLQRLGFEVRVIGKFFDWQNTEEIKKYWTNQGVSVMPVPYVLNRISKVEKFKMLLKHPFCLDGSVLEYVEPNIQEVFKRQLDEFKPDYVWFDYTYLWPLYKMAQERKLPIFVRSINFEARHFLEEDGRTILNYLKYIPKYFTEKITAKAAKVVFSITPLEKKMYEKVGAKRVVNLPLRALSKKLNTHTPKETPRLHVFFSGSTYNVSHNKRALEFIIKELAPKVYKKFGNTFAFHITGAKFPDELKSYLIDNVVYDGFVSDMEKFLEGMDIALVPSFYGAGMQQKIFEPLARGFPTLTHKRGLADYDFVAGDDVLTADSINEFIQQLDKLQSFDLRKKLSNNCKKKSQEQFSREFLDKIVFDSIINLK